MQGTAQERWMKYAITAQKTLSVKAGTPYMLNKPKLFSWLLFFLRGVIFTLVLYQGHTTEKA